LSKTANIFWQNNPIAGRFCVMAKNKKTSRFAKGQYRIFLSHATVDKFIAKAMCQMLDAVGAKTFRDDRDIDGGDDIPEKIREAIKTSDEFVVLLTPNSVSRPWVNLEVGAAWGWARLRIIAVHYNINVGADPIPAMLKSKKAVALNDFETYVEEVEKRLKGSKT
jgi:hypothetical protein